MTTPAERAEAAAAGLPAAISRCREHGMEVDVEGLLKHMMNQGDPAHALTAEVMNKYSAECTAQLVPPRGEAVGPTATVEAESLSPQAAPARAPSGHEDVVGTVRTTSVRSFGKASMDIKPYPR
jgi:hypothetical protein